MKKTISSLILTLLVSVSTANEHNYLDNFNSYVNVTSVSNDNLGNLGYGTTPSAPSFWTLRQWNNTTPQLTPYIFPISGEWSRLNGNTRVKFYPYQNGKYNVYELAVAGVPCSQEGAVITEAHELDLFLEALGLHQNSSISLGNMGQLEMALDLDVIYSDKSSKCNVNLQSDTFSIVLQTKTSPIQTFFVQFELGGLQAPFSGANGLSWCPSYEGNKYPNQFCLGASISSVGGSYLRGLGNRNIRYDILPKLTEIIKSNHKKTNANDRLNNDLNSWHITSAYLGKVNYGDVSSTSLWANPKLAASGGAFCTASKIVRYVCGKKPLGNNWVYAGGNCHHRATNIDCNW